MYSASKMSTLFVTLKMLVYQSKLKVKNLSTLLLISQLATYNSLRIILIKNITQLPLSQ